jgi:hypothetical protein
MKKFLVLIALVISSTAALAQWQPYPQPPRPVYPFVNNYGSYAQVTVSNPNQNWVWCTGSLSMYMDGPENKVHTAHVNLSVYPRGYMHQTYRPNSSDRIRHVSHNIWCH